MNPFANKWGLLVIALTLIAMGGAVVLVIVPAPKTPIDTATTTPNNNNATNTLSADLITVDTLTASTTGLRVAGRARGPWYFEASFPIRVLNASGVVIAQGPAQAQSDWMTQDFVPFIASFNYPAQSKGSHGTLVLKNDNPSGDPARDQSVSIPIVFN